MGEEYDTCGHTIEISDDGSVEVWFKHDWQSVYLLPEETLKLYEILKEYYNEPQH